MIAGDDATLRQKPGSLAGESLEGYETFLVGRKFRQPHADFLLGLWSGGESHVAGSDPGAVGSHGPSEDIFIQTLEIESVLNLEKPLGGILRQDFHVLIDVLYLGHRRVRGPVWRDDSVAVEIAVARRVLTVVTAVRPVHSAVAVGLVESLVDPVPDETALEVRIFIDVLPLAVKRAVGIAHRVGIFRRHDRLRVAALSHLVKPLGVRVLRHKHVRVPF